MQTTPCHLHQLVQILQVARARVMQKSPRATQGHLVQHQVVHLKVRPLPTLAVQAAAVVAREAVRVELRPTPHVRWRGLLLKQKQHQAL